MDIETGFEWSVRDDEIIIYHFKDSRRATVDKWVEIHREHRDTHNAEGRPLKRLWYFGDSFIPTPYAGKVTIQMAREMPSGTRTQIACVITNSRLYALTQFVFRRIDTRKDYVRFFNNEASALEWLQTAESPVG
ncbi:MAG: hypothetical protein KC615_05615 [Anaerolineae bacterium]|nr:hypothetical protein [Anaerolineae bacterium]